MDNTSVNPESALEDLVSLWQRRRTEGEPATPAELCRDRPELLPELERRIAVLERMAGLADATHETATLDTASSQQVARGPADWPEIPGYEILGELGRGAMGIVYKARHLRLNRVVALKMVQDSRCLHPENLVRFLSEAEAVAGVHHPHIAQIYDVGQINSRPYYTMESVEGGTLAQKIARAPQSARQAAHMVEMLARAAHAAHQCGIVHRDLKPANVLLAADGTPRITDFGLAKRIQSDSGLTQTGEILGTPGYMAPEQADGRNKNLGPLTDVYALGAILYEMLTGRPPFVGVTVLDVLDQVRKKEPLPFTRLRIRVPRDLETICQKCLQKEPRHRYASAEKLAEDLRRFQEGRPIVARPIGVLASVWLWAHRPERVTGAGVYAVAMGAVLILWALFGLASLGSRLLPQARPQEAVCYFVGLIGLVYCPLIFIGLSTIARKLSSLWLGLGFGCFWFAVTQAMAHEHLLDLNFDMAGIYSSVEVRSTTFTLLSFITLIGVLLYVAALLAYYSNRELMEEEKRTAEGGKGGSQDSRERKRDR